jgi:hypothetical protein
MTQREPDYTRRAVDCTADLSAEDTALLQAALGNLGRLCAEARRCGIPVLLDAEQVTAL